MVHGSASETSHDRRGVFRGRADELSQLQSWAASGRRLVSIVGPAGVGKTRLAAETHDGPLIQGSALAESGLGALLQTDIAQPLSAGDEVTLVIDDAPSSIASVVAELLDRDTRLRVVVTSRSPLHIGGETLLVLGPLALPASLSEVSNQASRCESAQLFFDRATQARPSFRVVEGEVDAVRDVLLATGGLPLAIELIAPWVRALPLTEIARRCTESLELFVSKSRELPAHHVDLRVAHELCLTDLPIGALRLARAIAAFRSAVGLDDLARVLGTSVHMSDLVELSDRGVVTLDGGQDQVRVTMLPTFAVHLRSESADADFQARHDQWVLEMVDRLDNPPEPTSPNSSFMTPTRGLAASLLDEIDAMSDQGEQLAEALLGAAHLISDFGLAQRALPTIRRAQSAPGSADDTCDWLGVVEARCLTDLAEYHAADIVLRRLLARDTNSSAGLRVAAGLELARLQRVTALPPASTEIVREVQRWWPEQGVDSLEWRGSRAWKKGLPARWCNDLAHLALVEGRLDEAEALLDGGISAALTSGDPAGAAWGLILLSHVQGPAAGGVPSLATLERAVQVARQLATSSVELVYALTDVSLVLAGAGETASARAVIHETLRLANTIEQRFDISQIRRLLGLALAEVGETSLALDSFRAAFAAAELFDHRLQVAWMFVALALAAPPAAPPLEERGALISAAEQIVHEPFDLAFGPYLERAKAAAAASPAEPTTFEEGLDIARRWLWPKQPTTGPAASHSLSRREVDILRALREGATDKEIAASMVIGVRTVNSHVSSILRKLGVANRRQARDWARRNDV